MQIGEQMSHKQLIVVKHIAIHTWEWTYEVDLKPLKLIRHNNGLYINIYVYVRVYEKICFTYVKL
jgi:hypothetical protein